MERALQTPAAEPPGDPEPGPAGVSVSAARPAEPDPAAAPGAEPELTAHPAPEPQITGSPGPPSESAARAPRAPRRRWPRRALRTALTILLIAAAVLGAAELATPPAERAPALVTIIDGAHGTVPVQVEPSWRVSQAVVAAEDSGFYGNDGVDEVGLVRAFWGWMTGVDEGGSTITEQLAKVIYTGGRTGIADRVAQVALALKLDGHFTKTAVLSMYLSAVYFGNGYYGVLAASEGYFGRAPDQLTWAQASLLAGLPQAPSLLDPLRHLGAARSRQGYVLDRLVATGTLTRAEADAAAAAPLDLR
ncbi:MAG: biosynthetic peptidoglycan transglycosylase [Candidatus Dormibacteria bacterium]|jgi:penicillin-binding protein 1A